MGRNESGMKSAIKVKLKNNTMGLGHDQGAEFTFHWWDHIFNKAANSFKVNESEDGGVQLEKCEGKKLTPLLISNKRGLPTRLANKSLMYGTFVKAGTYDSSKVDQPADDEVINEFSSDSESDDDDGKGEKKGAIIDTVDKMDKLFYESGLTGHKAARHGHSLNGKLQRLQQQEQREQPKPPSDNSNGIEISTPKKVQTVDENFGSENNMIKTKKKKKKKKSVSDDTDKCDGSEVRTVVEEVVKEKKKKKKRKNMSEEVGEVDSVTLVASPTTDMSNIKQSKKHKLNEMDENLVLEEAPKKKKKKKKENN